MRYRQSNTDSNKTPITSEPIEKAASHEPHSATSDIIALALPLALVSLFCTFALGQSWKESLFALFENNFGSLALVLIAFIGFVMLVYWRWKYSMSIDTFLEAFALPLSLPLLVTLFENFLPESSIGSLLMLTQILYLLFTWTSLLLIGRMPVTAMTVNLLR